MFEDGVAINKIKDYESAEFPRSALDVEGKVGIKGGN
jgi:hypothetical protein